MKQQNPRHFERSKQIRDNGANNLKASFLVFHFQFRIIFTGIYRDIYVPIIQNETMNKFGLIEIGRFFIPIRARYYRKKKDSLFVHSLFSLLIFVTQIISSGILIEICHREEQKFSKNNKYPSEKRYDINSRVAWNN